MPLQDQSANHFIAREWNVSSYREPCIYVLSWILEAAKLSKKTRDACRASELAVKKHGISIKETRLVMRCACGICCGFIGMTLVLLARVWKRFALAEVTKSRTSFVNALWSCERFYTQLYETLYVLNSETVTFYNFNIITVFAVANKESIGHLQWNETTIKKVYTGPSRTLTARANEEERIKKSVMTPSPKKLCRYANER